MKTILIVSLSFLIQSKSTFEKTFQGWHSDTNWIFQFRENGKYIRSSFGHFGNTVVKGRYKINNDTIHILTGFKNTYQTVNEYYVLKDSCLINLSSGYDYKLIPNTEKKKKLNLFFGGYSSFRREIK